MELERTQKTCQKLIAFTELEIGGWFTGISGSSSLCQKINDEDFIRWSDGAVVKRVGPTDVDCVEVEIELIRWHEKY